MPRLFDPSRTIGEAFRVAGELTRSGRVSEAGYVFREAAVPLAGSPALTPALEWWSRLAHHVSTDADPDLGARLHRLAHSLATEGFPAEAVRVLTLGLRHLPGGGIGPVAVRRRTSTLAALAEAMKAEGLECLRRGVGEGIALVAGACRIAGDRAWPLDDVQAAVRELPPRRPPPLPPDMVGPLAETSYAFGWLGQYEPAVHVGLLVPCMQEEPFGVDWMMARSGSPVQTTISRRIVELARTLLDKGYPAEASELSVIAIDIARRWRPFGHVLWTEFEREILPRATGLRPSARSHMNTLAVSLLNRLRPTSAILMARLPEVPLGEPGVPEAASGWTGPAIATGAALPQQKRYTNVLVTESEDPTKTVSPDQPLVATRAYKLVIEVSPERAGLGEDDAAFPDQALDKCWDADKSLSILVAVSSSHFQIEPSSQPLELPRQGPSSPIRFGVTPILQSGWGFIQVELFYRGNLLQSKQIEAYVVPSSGVQKPVTTKSMQTARTTFTITSKLNPVFLNQLPERVLAILVERDPKSSTFDFRYLDRTQGDAQVAFYHTQVQAANLETAIEAVRGNLEQAANAYAFNIDGTDQLFNQWLPVLAHLGRNLYRMLLPANEASPSTNDRGERLKAILKPDAVIQVNPVVGKTTVPWAILYERLVTYVQEKTRVCDRFADCGPDCDGCPNVTDPYMVCPHGFWGYRYCMEQLPCWTNGGDGDRSELVRGISNNKPLKLSLNVWNQFKFWKKHREKLKGMIHTDPLVAERLAEMERIWKENGDLDVVYFYCHGGNDPRLQEPYLELSDARVYSNILESIGANWPHRPLVFLNGCATGDYRPHSYINLIDDFRKSGASGVVGTECPVPEFFAEAFASEIFPLFFHGELLGKAMLEMRRQYLRRKNPLGMAYTLYAAHEIALSSAVT